ncbi:IS110 family transposase [Lachnospiraceae bacterium ZAX-1]
MLWTSKSRKLLTNSTRHLLLFRVLAIPSAAIILAEIGDISNFTVPAKLLAFARMEPSTYQSGIIPLHNANGQAGLNLSPVGNYAGRPPCA